MQKRKLIVSSLLSIAMCSSLAIGGTYALFTSEDSVNIAVTSGKVEMTAKITNATMDSSLGNPMGSANIADNGKSVDLALMAPGDFATVSVDVANESNVTIMYRISATVTGDLAPALVVDATIGATTYANVGNYVSGWNVLEATDEPSDVSVKVTFPDAEDNNFYQNKAANVAIAVEAVQGNAVAISEDVKTEAELKAALEGTATHKQVKLASNVALSQAIQTKAGTNTILDLNGYTISTEAARNSAGRSPYAIDNYGTMTISNGTIEARGVENFGTMTIKNGTFKAIDSTGGAAVWNEGNLTINGGTFVGGGDNVAPDAGCINSSGTLTINGGTFTNDTAATYPIITTGTTTINGGNFTSPAGVVCVTAGNTTINGGEFNCTTDTHSHHTLYVEEGATATVNGGKFTSTGLNCVVWVHGTFNLNGGEYSNSVADTLILVAKNGEVVLGDVEITAEKDGQSVIKTQNNNTKVIANGTAKLTAGKNGTAIYVPAKATANISGTGKLIAIGNNGADYQEGAVDYSSTTDASFAGTGGNGIGGEGAIVINGLNALVAEGYGNAGFGIGGASTSITIKNTNIEYVRGGFVNTKGTVLDAKYTKAEPEGGAAIGSLTNGAAILLENVKITKALGGSKAAGIGARYWTSVSVTIKNSTIDYVEGGASSAAIGGSRVAEGVAQYANVTISDSTITAQGGYFGAGIGSGYDTHCSGLATTTIYITGDSVINATGGKYAAGVGTGFHVGGLFGKIENTVTVNASANAEKFYKAAYTTAQAIGWGVADPTREGQAENNFVYNGMQIPFPNPNP